MSIEYKIHRAILIHIRTAFPHIKIFHIPNQSRDATEAFFNKQMGVLPGVSDFILGWSRKLYGGAGVGVLEVKTDDGKLSRKQNMFISWADDIGWEWGVARSVRQAHNVLKGWGLVPKHEAIAEPDLRTDEQKRKDCFDFYKP